ncbi:LLM class flavin-dependent oxidoreductase [Bosea lathyri]|uniref:Flavin-dependent oxidoreductase, luciferase family (Includes alkanesulfonate monooxygenase SsuD and methylene tetrahydromethanopterin reductase) n=1 Tax=Bosea lathyri TaxID=1036778 RepID=A0A1H5W529_9HYPH|nr:LLM class flavin-dependent oxidoreductase [Bosea lathyri]SEF94595.1 Flavin-dependent oxidoreductase, luciferase family (includes alkanesulfonate monooxygenase SsuD and methylene tetrahydromethanopterin reductase) [Bosea lathyri]
MTSPLAIGHVGFLTPGNYAENDPLKGLEDTLQLFALGEQLGFDSAWVRQRHLEPGISSASVFLAAATQRTQRIELGTAVIQIGYENPFRLAEDLSLVDVLAGGRLNVGISAGPPPHASLLGQRFLDGDGSGIDYSHERVARLAANLDGAYLGSADTVITSAAGRLRPRLQPYAPRLRERLWYGGGSLRSARWAGSAGLNLLIGNINTGEGTDDFLTAQLRHLDAYRESFAGSHEPRIAVGRVIVPLDSADAQTRRRYLDYAASRTERTLAPQGERRTLFCPDIVGTAEQILEKLTRDPVLGRVQELRLELPYQFEAEDYQQIIGDFIRLIAPELGWRARPVIEANLRLTA